MENRGEPKRNRETLLWVIVRGREREGGWIFLQGTWVEWGKGGGGGGWRWGGRRVGEGRATFQKAVAAVLVGNQREREDRDRLEKRLLLLLQLASPNLKQPQGTVFDSCMRRRMRKKSPFRQDRLQDSCWHRCPPTPILLPIPVL